MSDIDYEMKQVVDLEDSILRLCNEADNNLIKLNGLLSALTTFAVEMGIPPVELIKIITFYISNICSKKVKEQIDKMNIGAPDGIILKKRL
jgi:hypothetical protein